MKLTDRQRQAKARFWQAVAGNPLVDPERLTDQKVASLAGFQQATEWLQDDEFRDWFFNQGYNRQLLETGVEDTIKALIAIVQEDKTDDNGKPLAKPSDKIAAGRTLLEFAGYAPAKTHKHQHSQTAVDDMSETELQEFIQKQAKRLMLSPNEEN